MGLYGRTRFVNFRILFKEKNFLFFFIFKNLEVRVEENILGIIWLNGIGIIVVVKY